jgi:TonB family protein
VTVSAAGHVLTTAAFLLLAGVWNQWNASKVYVVNLVPAVSIMGSPTSRSTVPSLPPRRIISEPQRPAPEPVAKEVPAAPKPADPSLPQPRAASRPAVLPRPGEKELPPLTASAERRSAAAPARSENPSPAVEARSAVPPVPLGRPDGSPAGVASLALEVSNFPFTWYLQQVQRKVTEKWVQPKRATEPGLRVVVLFEIGRDGQVTSTKVEQSSGNSWYDQSALRAIVEANPFPPLPEGFPGQSLRVHFGFDFKSS